MASIDQLTNIRIKTIRISRKLPWLRIDKNCAFISAKLSLENTF
jgi:hypothetical protein